VISSEDISLKEVLEKTNRRIREYATEGYFVTVFYGILDISHRGLQYIRAGHNPPLLYRKNSDEFVFLEGKGTALGVVEDIYLETRHVEMNSGDILLLFTDGVTEAIDHQEEEFGVESLCNLVREHQNCSAKEIIDNLCQELEIFVAEEPQFDDITVMVIKI